MPDLDRPVRMKLPHSIPPWVGDGSFYFITICGAVRGQNQFCQDRVGPKILSTVAFYHEHLKWHCRLFLLMPDHVHGIIAFPREPGMRTTIKAWKSYQAKFQGIEWQADFFDHRLRDRFSMDEKISYVLQNPVRAGLCTLAEQWPYVYRPMNRLI